MINLKTCLLVIILLLPAGYAGASSEVHILSNGKLIIKEAKVMQIAGTTLYARLYWDDAFVRIMIKANDKTKVFRATGEVTSLKEVKVNDFLELEGVLESGSDSLVVLPTLIKNSSVKKAQKTVSGPVRDIKQNQAKITILDKKEGLITLNILPTSLISKGTKTVGVDRVRVGDIIISANGDYDYSTKTLESNSIKIYQDMKMFEPRIYEGKLKGLTDNTLAVSINNVDYAVYLGSKTTILKNNRSSTTISRFEISDNIRVYGKLRESEENIIDAEVVRNTSL